ncbi:MAG: hypothetical protein H6735_05510 [Alphaproteobacteria bacterium]|nr:hypothetical protein [Alphaproteobacteria bacterium]
MAAGLVVALVLLIGFLSTTGSPSPVEAARTDREDAPPPPIGALRSTDRDPLRPDPVEGALVALAEALDGGVVRCSIAEADPRARQEDLALAGALRVFVTSGELAAIVPAGSGDRRLLRSRPPFRPVAPLTRAADLFAHIERSRRLEPPLGVVSWGAVERGRLTGCHVEPVVERRLPLETTPVAEEVRGAGCRATSDADGWTVRVVDGIPCTLWISASGLGLELELEEPWPSRVTGQLSEALGGTSDLQGARALVEDTLVMVEDVIANRTELYATLLADPDLSSDEREILERWRDQELARLALPAIDANALLDRVDVLLPPTETHGEVVDDPR